MKKGKHGRTAVWRIERQRNLGICENLLRTHQQDGVQSTHPIGAVRR